MFLKRFPILTQSLSTGLMFGLGDILAQFENNLNTKQTKKYDLKRTLKLFAYGTFIVVCYVYNRTGTFDF